jgi:radical SAM protein with 4Fe4S-binding SPASM domain
VTHSYVETCFYPWKAARVNPYGDVYSCSIDVAFGNIRQAPFSQLWNGEAYQVFRRTLKQQGIFPKCTKCCALSDRLWDQLPHIKLPAARAGR